MACSLHLDVRRIRRAYAEELRDRLDRAEAVRVEAADRQDAERVAVVLAGRRRDQAADDAVGIHQEDEAPAAVTARVAAGALLARRARGRECVRDRAAEAAAGVEDAGRQVDVVARDQDDRAAAAAAAAPARLPPAAVVGVGVHDDALAAVAAAGVDQAARHLDGAGREDRDGSAAAARAAGRRARRRPARVGVLRAAVAAAGAAQEDQLHLAVTVGRAGLAAHADHARVLGPVART
ncbi:MAG: hypothetical protein ACYTGI_19535, partial [Planctomycetota bacterium]